MTAYTLHYGSNPEILATVVEDDKYPRIMWRVLWPDGQLSNIVNLSRAKDTAMAYGALQIAQSRTRLRWKEVTKQSTKTEPMRYSSVDAPRQPSTPKSIHNGLSKAQADALKSLNLNSCSPSAREEIQKYRKGLLS